METVQMLNTAEIDTAERVEEEVKLADLNALNKNELIEIIKRNEEATAHYEARIKTQQEEHEKETKDISEYYLKRINELKKLIEYYERKLKVLKDIITIETGDEK